MLVALCIRDGCWQPGVSFEVAVIAARLAVGATVDGSAIGFAGEESDQYRLSQQLRLTATTRELIVLLDHWSPVSVRTLPCSRPGMRRTFSYIDAA